VLRAAKKLQCNSGCAVNELLSVAMGNGSVPARQRLLDTLDAEVGGAASAAEVAYRPEIQA